MLAEHGGHIVAVRQGNALATSFHPELTGDHRVHDLFVDMVRACAPRALTVQPSPGRISGEFVQQMGYAKETGRCPATLNGLRRSTRRP